jgi:hypothetical protein
MSVHLKPETEARIAALAAASGISVDDYLAALGERDAPENEPASPPEFSHEQFEKEQGIWVYRIGIPIPPSMVEDTLQTIRRQREEHSFGNIPA